MRCDGELEEPAIWQAFAVQSSELRAAASWSCSTFWLASARFRLASQGTSGKMRDLYHFAIRSLHAGITVRHA